MSPTIYTTTIPSTAVKVKYRPFLVKEEKSLLIAQQSEDSNVMVDTLKSIIKSCVLDKIDVDTLAMFDLEYLLLQIRARSIGEVVELVFGCDNCTDEKAKAKVFIDLTTIDLQKDPEHTNKIELFDDVGMIMKYPNIDSVKKFEELDLDDVEHVFDLVIESIDYIYSGEELHYAKEQTKEELSDFIGNLTQIQFQKVKAFFESMPKLRHDIFYTCPVCQKTHNKYIEGIDSFF
tara:strand:- start:164 stop:862 length:699 start_codon:yes stop_codon:yes gene_type:complete